MICVPPPPVLHDSLNRRCRVMERNMPNVVNANLASRPTGTAAVWPLFSCTMFECSRIEDERRRHEDATLCHHDKLPEYLTALSVVCVLRGLYLVAVRRILVFFGTLCFCPRRHTPTPPAFSGLPGDPQRLLLRYAHDHKALQGAHARSGHTQEES